MPSDRWNDRHDRINKPNEYERGDVDYNLILPMNEFFGDGVGWEPTPWWQKENQLKFYNLDLLGLSAPLTVDSGLPWPKTVDGMTIVNAYEQNGGKCAAFSTMQSCTGYHMLRDGTPSGGTGKRFDANTFYCKVRAKMGDPRCNASAGATMPAVGAVFTKDGASQIVNGKPLPYEAMNGAASYLWGRGVDSIRTAVAGGKIYPLIGITIYQHFLSPKKIGDHWWVCWSDGSWGTALGGHMMVILDCFDSIKINPTSRGSFRLPGTWGYGFPDARMSYEAFERLLKAAMGAEIMLFTDRVVGPAGKLELAEPFTVAVSADFKATAHMKVKNTGEGNLTGISLAIEDMVDGVGKNGFGFTPDFDLEPGAVYDHNPERPDPLTSGHWRFRGDYKQAGRYNVLGTVEVDVTDVPPPPPPPPAGDTVKFKEETLTDESGKVYSTKADQPEGVTYRKVQ